MSKKLNKLRRRLTQSEKYSNEALERSLDMQQSIAALKKERDSLNNQLAIANQKLASGQRSDGSIVLSLREDKYGAARYLGSPTLAMSVEVRPEPLFMEWQSNSRDRFDDYVGYLHMISLDIAKKLTVALEKWFREKMGF